MLLQAQDQGEEFLDAYVLIQSDLNGESLARKVRSIPGVVAAEDLAGAYDAIALARSGSLDRLVEGVVSEIRRLPGVTRAIPAPLIRSLIAQPDRARFSPGKDNRAA